MTVIQFPRKRSMATVPVDIMIDELNALELKLARARLAQVRAETRQANALWLSYCLKRVLLWGMLLWVLTAFAGAAVASQKDWAAPISGLWCSAPIPQGDDWRYYQRGGCTEREVEGSRWLILYPNGDYRETATSCKVIRSERGWSDYRCKIEGQRKPEMRHQKFLINDETGVLSRGWSQ